MGRHQNSHIKPNLSSSFSNKISWEKTRETLAGSAKRNRRKPNYASEEDEEEDDATVPELRNLHILLRSFCNFHSLSIKLDGKGAQSCLSHYNACDNIHNIYFFFPMKWIHDMFEGPWAEEGSF